VSEPGTTASVPTAGPSRLSGAVLRSVRDGNTFEATVEQLASSIRLGVFGPGEHLPPERELAETLGVSRSTLREAIGALRQAGMVQTRRGRGGGTVVVYRAEEPGLGAPAALRRRAAAEDRARLRDVLDYRRVVEPGACALAATRDLTADQRAWLAGSRSAVEQAEDAAAHRVADSRLHLALATLSGSRLLVAAVTEVQREVHEMLVAIPVLAPNIAHSNSQHRRVVDCVLAGNPEGARGAMEAHCDATSALLRGLLG
jgi:GntR family transcriptional regulator, transcriptional repressor for pyruvate dehydrogenase complex